MLSSCDRCDAPFADPLSADASGCRAEAMRHVRVPKSVIAMIADLRSHLQENLEPPVYVSDRRLVKAIGMLQARCLAQCSAPNCYT